jgi:hypothetical protein
MKNIHLWRAGILLVALLVSGNVFAIEKCLRQVGSDYIRLTAFQAQLLSPGEQACDNLQLGSTTLTLDYEGEALRNMKAEVQIIEVESWSATLDDSKDDQAKTVLHVPMQTYPQGLIVVEHSFNQPGYFAELVSLEEPGGQKHFLRFPFRVGIGWGTRLMEAGAVIISLIVLAMASGIAYYFLIYRKKKVVG